MALCTTGIMFTDFYHLTIPEVATSLPQLLLKKVVS